MQPSTCFKISKAESLVHAQKIRDLLKDTNKMKELKKIVKGCLNNPNDLTAFIESWATFLETCGGYEAF